MFRVQHPTSWGQGPPVSVPTCQPSPPSVNVRLSFETYVPGPFTVPHAWVIEWVVSFLEAQINLWRVYSRPAVSRLDGGCLIKSLGGTGWTAGAGLHRRANVSIRINMGRAPMDADLSWQSHDGAPLGPGPRVLGILRVAQDAILIPWRVFHFGGSQLEDDPSGFRTMPECALVCHGCTVGFVSRSPCLSPMSRRLHQALSSLLLRGIPVTSASFSDGQHFMPGSSTRSRWFQAPLRCPSRLVVGLSPVLNPSLLPYPPGQTVGL